MISRVQIFDVEKKVLISENRIIDIKNSFSDIKKYCDITNSIF